MLCVPYVALELTSAKVTMSYFSDIRAEVIKSLGVEVWSRVVSLVMILTLEICPVK